MSKSTRKGLFGSSRGSRNGKGTASNAVETFTRPNKSTPVLIALIIWRWRWELFTTGTLVSTWIVLHNHGLNDLETTGLMIGPFAVMLAVGPTRRFWRNRLWCVITRHRVRACLSEMRTLNYSGNLPFIICCRSTKVGESVWLWMRPGLSETDLENRSETLASACWAREARIERSRKNAALIRIDIDRRDPLAKAQIVSPLVDDTSHLPDGQVEHDVVLDFIRPDKGAEPVPTTASTSDGEQPANSEPAVHQETRKVKKSKPTVHADSVDKSGPVVLLNGEDVSDYV